MPDQFARELLAALNALFDTVADEQVQEHAVHEPSAPASFSDTSMLAADEATSGGKLARAICVAMSKVQTRIV